MEKLDKLKKDFEVLARKYNLPSFKELNEDFSIESAAETETDILLREIRKIMMDKAISYGRFSELLMNPSSAPLFFFKILKGIGAEDKKVLDDLYERIGKLEIEVIEIDNDYSEKSEAEFIRHISQEWKIIKDEMRKISKALKSGWDKKRESKEKSYLG